MSSTTSAKFSASKVLFFTFLAAVCGYRHGHFEEQTSLAGNGGLCDSSVKQLSGYYKVNSPNSTDKNYFYWMFESRVAPKDAPFILWLTGGPGCSGMMALLGENGPCTIERGLGGLEAKNNTQSWTNAANVLWIDQPVGVGFSYSEHSSDSDHGELGVREDMYFFITEFMSAHPEYATSKFYIFGESYGGHYAPNVAFRILLGNQDAVKNGLPKINLAGVAVGNGLTDPEIQYKYYAAQAYNNTYGIKVVTETVAEAMVAELAECIPLIQQCQNDTSVCAQAQQVCNQNQIGPYQQTGQNVYDVRKPCETPPLCYDFSKIEDWLLENAKALGVDTTKAAPWTPCNFEVDMNFRNDWMKGQQYTLPPLLAAGVPVLLYAGDADFICNWLGNKAWTMALDWPGKDAFNAAQDHDWTVSGEKAGTARTAKGLTFLQVNKAGHMVPMDQPKNSLSMIETFMSGGDF